MSRTASLSTKLVRIGTIILVLALTSIGLTLWVTWQLEGGAAAVNEAGRMRMQIWRLAGSVQGPAAPEAIAARVDAFDASLRLLRAGDPGRPLFVPWNAQVGADFAELERQWQTQRSAWLDGPQPAPAEAGAAADRFVVAIDHVVSGIERQLSRLTAILNLFQLLMLAMAIGSAVIVLYTGYLHVISPLGHVRQGLRRIEAGDFDTRITVDTADEFGQVAAGFNRMASTLQSLYRGLEAKVDAKTRRIEAQRARLEALYEVSAFLAEATTLQAMAQGFAQRVRVLARADAAVVRWSEDNLRWLLVAADGFPQRLCEQEHSLAAGACACGNLQPASMTRVIAIHPDAPERRHACSKAGYTAMVSVPVRLQHRLVGELNLFFVDAVKLSNDETDLLDALASHLASGLEGLRAAALEREAAAAGERTRLARELHDSIAQSLAFLRIQAQLLRNSLQRAQPDKVQTCLDELDAGLLESVNDVRELLLHFRTRTNTDDVEPALQTTLQKFRHQTGLRAHLEIHGQGLPLAPDVQVQMLHVVQEALSNVRKHSRATQVWLEVAKGRCWRFTVRDDGVGFDPKARLDETHVGLKIMRERAAGIGATVSVVAVPGAGTTVVLALPEHPVASGTRAAPATVRRSTEEALLP